MVPCPSFLEHFSREDLRPPLLEMHLLGMTFECHWKVLGLMLVCFCLRGLCAQGIISASMRIKNNNPRVRLDGVW